MRSEYWFFVLFNFLVQLVLEFIMGLLMIPLLLKGQFNAESISGVQSPFVYIAMAVGLLLFLPSLGALVRRLHDTNRSGWWVAAYYLFAIVLGVLSGIAGLRLFAMGENPSLSTSETPLAFVFAVALVGVLLFVMAIVLLVWCFQRGTIGPNKYGPDPLADEYVDVQLSDVNTGKDI